MLTMLVLGLVDIPCWLLLLTAFIALLWYSWPDVNYFRKRGIPCERAYPIVGTALPFFIKPAPDLDKEGIAKYGDQRCIGGFLGSTPALTVFDPDMLSEIYVKQFPAFINRMTFRSGSPMNDNSLLNLEDAHWKHVRNEMTPTFTSGKLKQMNGEINRCSIMLADSLLEQAEKGGEVEMKEFAGGFTMDVTASVAFGIRVNSQKDRNNEFVEHARKAFVVPQFNPAMIIAMFFPKLAVFLPKLGINIDFFPKYIQDFFGNITRQTIDMRKSDQDQSRTDFIQLMIKAQKGENISKTEDGDQEQDTTSGTGLTTDEILANAMLFFIGGYDTTATSLSFFMYNMARYPDIQDKLVDEINTVVGNKEDIDANMVQEMPYLDQCVNENLRMYPPLTSMVRVAKHDTTVQGVFIEKGTVIGLPMNAIHHDPRKWPEPDEFDPERFSPENKKDRNPYHFVPFGAGPRNCIGMRLALQELKVAIIHVLRKVKIVKSEKTKIPITFTFNASFLRAKDGIFLKVEARGAE